MRPFDGVRIVDLTEGAQGPYAATLLADMGAEVVKIERPGGEMMRRLGPFRNGAALPVLTICRGRYANVELDIKNAEAFAVLLDLLGTADMLIQNWKPGTDDALGLGFEQIRKVNPTIVYVRSSGYGVAGPYGRMGSMDSLSQAISGMARVSGEPEGGGERTRTPVLDFVSAFVTAEAATIGLLSRRRSGRAVLVETSQMSAAIEALAPEVAREEAEGRPLQPASRRSNFSPFGGFFRCADGDYVGFDCAGEQDYAALCDSLGLSGDGRDSEAVEAALAERSVGETVSLLAELGIVARPVARHLAFDLFSEHPGTVTVYEDPRIGAVRHPLTPWDMSVTPPVAGPPLGTVGRDNALLDALIQHWRRPPAGMWSGEGARTE